MKYFIKYQERIETDETLNFVKKTMFITCNNIEQGWHEHKQESANKLKLLDVTPLPNS